MLNRVRPQVLYCLCIGRFATEYWDFLRPSGTSRRAAQALRDRLAPQVVSRR
jgi:hypothetical protein